MSPACFLPSSQSSLTDLMSNPVSLFYENFTVINKPISSLILFTQCLSYPLVRLIDLLPIKSYIKVQTSTVWKHGFIQK